MKHPTPDQLARLKDFATKHGKEWKDDLNTMWRKGADVNEPDGHLLRQVRNQLGPTWLHEFKL